MSATTESTVLARLASGAEEEHDHPVASGLSLRDAAPAWAALVVLAVGAWALTAVQAGDMGVGPGTMGMALPLFLATWVAMMAAMMFPSVAPVAILWTRSIARRTTGAERAFRIGTFVSGYLVAWTGFGAVAFAALLGTDRLVMKAPGAARWVGAGLFALAGIYQLTPLKDVCLRHCRSPLAQLLHYGDVKGRARDLRVGVYHGLYCVGCCWGLMVVLVAVGVMNLAAMAGLAAVIFLEKLWRGGAVLSKVVGVGFLALAALAPFHPALLPGLRSMMTTTMGM